MGYYISGSHPKLRMADDLLKIVERLKQEVREEQETHRRSLKAEYKHRVIASIEEHERSFSKLEKGDEYIRIESRLVNKQEFNEHMELFGSISDPPNNIRHSVRYFRKYGILLYDHGGWIVLKDTVPCSDEEWEELKQGKLDKFIK